jgi:hypothetical protein
MTQSIAQIYCDLKGRKHLMVDDVAQRYFPERPQTIVPLAISLALITKSAEATTLFAANLGGDSDSVASIGGAIAGALSPATVNERWFEIVSTINGDNLLDVATSLAALRPAF